MINDLHAQNELTEKTAKFLANLRARTKTKKKKQATATGRAFGLFGFASSVACIKGIKMLLYKTRTRVRAS